MTTRVKSLKELASKRLKFASKINYNPEDAQFIFEIYYTSLIELLHALTISRGVSVKNHICLAYFLRDVMNNKELFNRFDECRKQRNSLIYYGDQIMPEKAKEITNKTLSLTLEIERLL